MIDNQPIEIDWKSRGFSFGTFTDAPGQVWADYVHPIDELWMLGHGEMELEIKGEIFHPKLGEEFLIPAKCIHTLRNIGSTYAHWYYGYKQN